MIEPDMIMRNIVLSVISLLSLKMVISQELLIIRAVYCSEFSDKHNRLPKEFFHTLKTVTKKCLQWFKYLLLKSTARKRQFKMKLSQV